MNSKKTQTLNKAKKLKTGKDQAGQVYYFLGNLINSDIICAMGELNIPLEFSSFISKKAKA